MNNDISFKMIILVIFELYFSLDLIDYMTFIDRFIMLAYRGGHDYDDDDDHDSDNVNDNANNHQVINQVFFHIF